MAKPTLCRPLHLTPEVILFNSCAPTGCGLKLTAEYLQEGKGIPVNGTLEWDTAPVSGFGEPGGAIPALSARRCTQKIDLNKISLQPGQPFIAGIRASNAREGTPGHGRWHVLILLAR